MILFNAYAAYIYQTEDIHTFSSITILLLVFTFEIVIYKRDFIVVIKR